MAVLGVAVTALGNASELETLFNPSKFEKFQNQNRTEEYDYMAGEGDNVDLADKDKNGEQNSGDDQDQQVLQILLELSMKIRHRNKIQTMQRKQE